MTEHEFDERLKRTKSNLEILFNSPLVQTHTIDKDKGEIVPIENHFKRTLLEIAADLTQIEIGIKCYSRPQEWSLIQEGIIK